MLRSPNAARPRRDQAPARASIVIFAAGRDWHTAKLTGAFARQNVETVVMRLEQCAFDTDARFGLRLGGFSDLPDGVLVKNVSGGSFESVTRRLGVLHALRTLGIPVWNDATAIERCVDKSMTTFLLTQAGLPVPQSWTVEGEEAARSVVAAETAAGPLVLKPLFGSQGRGLVLVRGLGDLPPGDALGGVFYLQRFVGGAGPRHHDFRIFVVNGEALAAMRRQGTTWITNLKQGGSPSAVPLDAELKGLAGAAAAAVGAIYCGVDILRAHDGTPYVLEVNSMPAWSGLQKVAPIDIADALAESFCGALYGRRQRQVT